MKKQTLINKIGLSMGAMMLATSLLSTAGAIEVEASEVKVPAAKAFPDVMTFKEEIGYLTGLGIINGHQDGTFRPMDNLKRVHAVEMVLREMGSTKLDAPNPGFIDMKPGDYGYGEIAKAVQLGFINGSINKNGQKVFNPNGTLTRGEMAKIITEAYKITKDSNVAFKDVPAGHWTKPFVSRLATANITNGYPDGSFKPNDKIQRQHFSAFMARHLNPAFKPVEEQKLMTRAQAEVHITPYVSKDTSGYSLMSKTGRYSIIIEFPIKGSGKAQMSVDKVMYGSGHDIRPEDFGQDDYDYMKAHFELMNGAVQAYAESQFGVGSKGANTLSAEIKKMAYHGYSGDMKKITIQGKTVTISQEGIRTRVSY